MLKSLGPNILQKIHFSVGNNAVCRTARANNSEPVAFLTLTWRPRCLISAVQYRTVTYGFVQYSTVQYTTVMYYTILYCLSSLQYSKVHQSTILYGTVQYITVQYCTVLYYIVLSQVFNQCSEVITKRFISHLQPWAVLYTSHLVQ